MITSFIVIEEYQGYRIIQAPNDYSDMFLVIDEFNEPFVLFASLDETHEFITNLRLTELLAAEVD